MALIYEGDMDILCDGNMYLLYVHNIVTVVYMHNSMMRQFLSIKTDSAGSKLQT